MMQFKYVRIQGKELARNTMYAKGVFSMCWKLVQDDVMEQEDADLFREIDGWFAENLPWPPQCMNREPVVCWFKTENSDESGGAVFHGKSIKFPLVFGPVN